MFLWFKDIFFCYWWFSSLFSLLLVNPIFSIQFYAKNRKCPALRVICICFLCIVTWHIFSNLRHLRHEMKIFTGLAVKSREEISISIFLTQEEEKMGTLLKIFTLVQNWGIPLKWKSPWKSCELKRSFIESHYPLCWPPHVLYISENGKGDLVSGHHIFHHFFNYP